MTFTTKRLLRQVQSSAQSAPPQPLLWFLGPEREQLVWQSHRRPLPPSPPSSLVRLLAPVSGPQLVPPAQQRVWVLQLRELRQTQKARRLQLTLPSAKTNLVVTL